MDAVLRESQHESADTGSATQPPVIMTGQDAGGAAIAPPLVGLNASEGGLPTAPATVSQPPPLSGEQSSHTGRPQQATWVPLPFSGVATGTGMPIMTGAVSPPGECQFHYSNVVNPQQLPSVPPTTSTSISSVCAPLSDNVPQVLREKIGRGEFVDLALLLENWGDSQAGQQRDITLSWDNAGRPVFRDARPQRRITSIAAWTSAFLVYTSVFLDFHPSRCQEILKYMHTIRSAATRFGSYGWRTYDLQFRMRQQRNPQNSWAVIDGELWFLYVMSPPPSRSGQAVSHFATPGPAQIPPFARAKFNQNAVPRTRALSSISAPGASTCFNFNKSSGCAWKPCKFTHVCSKCNMPNHNALACKKRK